ncbi:hypothetical protein T439DRAFT_330190 [Meredithblackwellia eburnea MCA 4105]
MTANAAGGGTTTLKYASFFQHDITMPDRGHSHAASPLRPSPNTGAPTGLFSSRVFPAHSLHFSFQLSSLPQNTPVSGFRAASVTLTVSFQGELVRTRTVQLGALPQSSKVPGVTMNVSTQELVLALRRLAVSQVVQGLKTLKIEAEVVLGSSSSASGESTVAPAVNGKAGMQGSVASDGGSPRMDVASVTKFPPIGTGANGMSVGPAGASGVWSNGAPSAAVLSPKALAATNETDKPQQHKYSSQIEILEARIASLEQERDALRRRSLEVTKDPLTFSTFSSAQAAYETLDSSPHASDAEILSCYESIISAFPPPHSSTLAFARGAFLSISLSRMSPPALLPAQSAILTMELLAYLNALPSPYPIPPPPNLSPYPPSSAPASPLPSPISPTPSYLSLTSPSFLSSSTSPPTSSPFVQKGLESAISKLDFKLQQAKEETEVLKRDVKMWKDFAERLAGESGSGGSLAWADGGELGKKKAKAMKPPGVVGAGGDSVLSELEMEREKRKTLEKQMEFLKARVEGLGLEGRFEGLTFGIARANGSIWNGTGL